jgi:hypothetical protein
MPLDAVGLHGQSNMQVTGDRIDCPSSLGGPCRIRTCDLLIKSQQLYQLS